jgi:hypothetical protein
MLHKLATSKLRASVLLPSSHSGSTADEQYHNRRAYSVTKGGSPRLTPAGYHRLWSHRAFTAALPLRITLAWMGSMGFQGSIKWWVLRHRLHHRYVPELPSSPCEEGESDIQIHRFTHPRSLRSNQWFMVLALRMDLPQTLLSKDEDDRAR